MTMKMLTLVFWVVTLCSLIGGYQASSHGVTTQKIPPSSSSPPSQPQILDSLNIAFLMN
jgi:hypothetical protein